MTSHDARMGKPSDHPVLALKLVYAAISCYRDPARFLRGTPPVWWFASLDTSYSGVRIWAARNKPDGNVFDADERMSQPAMPNWWIFGAADAFVAYSVSLAVWYIAPRLVRRVFGTRPHYYANDAV